MPAIRNRRLFPVLLSIVGLLGTVRLAADEPTLLTELPVRITESGDYRLGADLQFAATSGAAISIEADDVAIDFDGRTLRGTAGADTLAIGVRATSHRGLVLHNGTVTGFYFGVDIRNHPDQPPRSAQHEVSNLLLVRNHYFGMRLVGTDCRVRHCTVRDTGGSTRPRHTIPHGVRLVGTGNVMRDCTIIDLRLQHFPDGRGEIVGVHFDDAKGAVFADNCVMELANHRDDHFDASPPQERRFGMWINGGPQKDTFVTVSGNTFAGFPVPLAFAPGSNGTVSGNTFYGAGPKPIRGQPSSQVSENRLISDAVTDN